jgi:SPP1 gp7 family putative phage head morphogenesis protein
MPRRQRIGRSRSAPPAALRAMQRAYARVVEGTIRSWFARHRSLVQDAQPVGVLRLVEQAMHSIESSVDADVRKIEKVVGAEAAGGAQLLQAFRKRNVGLIKTVGAQTKARLDAALKRYGNLHVEALTAKLIEVADVSRSRARFWAVDQTLKLNADIVQAKHESLGIEEYVWRTSRDGSVRETHAALEGKRFRYDNPPETGTGKHNPGQDFRCRCHADPVLEPAVKPKPKSKSKPKPKPKSKSVRPPPVPQPTPEATFGSLLEQRSMLAADLERAVQTGRSVGTVRTITHQEIQRVFPQASRLIPTTELVIRSNAEMGTLQGYHDWRGPVVLRAGVAQVLVEGLRATPLKPTGTVFYRDAVRTLVHEELHAMSRTGGRGYRGIGRILEEAGTELNARPIAERALGVAPPTGAYEKLINVAIKPLETELGLSNAEAREMLRDAWARANYHGGAARETPEAVLQGWLAQLLVTDVQRARLARQYRDLGVSE